MEDREFPRMLTAKEAADVVGVSVATLYQMIRSGTVRSIRQGTTGNHYINEETLREDLRGTKRSLDT